MILVLILFLILGLGAVLTNWLIWKSRQSADAGRIKDRLLETPKTKKNSKQAPALIQTEEEYKGWLVVQLLQRLKLNERLAELLEQAGLKWQVARLAHACLLMLLAATTIGLRLAPPFYRPYILVPALCTAVLPLLFVVRKRRARLKQFEEQFPEALEFISRSMRAGHAFSVSLEMVHTEFGEPLAGEFRRTFDEQNLGLPLDVALQKLAQRVPSMDVHFFVSAVLLQKRTGGNLAELLDKLAYLIRERFKLRGRIRAISAHGKMTGMVLSAVPAGVALMMFWVNPGYIRFFVDDPAGRQLLAGAIALQLVGYAIIKKIVSIEV